MNKLELKKVFVVLITIIIMVIAFFVYYYNFKIEMFSLNIFPDKKYKIILIIFSLIAFLFSLVSLKILNGKKIERIHTKYFFTAIILGLCYVFIIPLFAQSDEPAHFLRAYEISEGYFITPTINNKKINKFDESIIQSLYNSEKQPEFKNYNDILNIRNIKQTGNKKELEMRASNYSVLNYIPHVLGILIGKLLNLSPLYLGIIGRIFSLFYCVFLISLGIKLLPKGKQIATILFLTPVFLSYSGAFSADGTTISYIFLFISYILNISEKKEVLNKKNYLILGTLAVCVSICKSVYLPIIFLLFFLPKEIFKNRKQEVIVKLFLIILGIISSLFWIKVSSVTVSSEEINNWIFTQPLKYIIILINSFLSNFYNEIKNIFAGNFLCHAQVNPYEFISFMFCIVNIFAFISEDTRKNKEQNKFLNIVIILTGIIIYVLISTAMYIGNTQEKASIIIGVQGRYLYPILLLFVFGIKHKKYLDIKMKYLNYTNIILNYFIMLTMITTFIF